MIKKRLFGNTDCKEVFAYELTNDKGTLSAEIITYGGIVRTLKYKGVDVVRFGGKAASCNRGHRVSQRVKRFDTDTAV